MTFHSHSLGMVITPNAPVVFNVDTYPEAVRGRARAAYDRGQAAFDAGRFNEALPGFTEAYRTIPHYSALQAIGQSLIGAGRYAEGIGRLQRVLAAFDSSPSERLPDTRRKLINNEINRARAAMRQARQTADPSILPPASALQVAQESAAVQQGPASTPANLEDGLSTGAKVAIGVGIAVGVTGLLGAAIWAATR